MKIVYVYGNMNHHDHGLDTVLKRTKDVFAELDVETETIDLGALHPPYYDGETTNALDGVMEKLKSADGVVLASTAQMFAPTALMQSFFEYLEHPDYSGIFKEKHCMIIALSREGGEKSALDYFTRIIRFLGGFDVVQVGLQKRHLENIEGGTGQFIDSVTEDFYRAVHKKRQYIIPTDCFSCVSTPVTIQKAETKKEPLNEVEQTRHENMQSQLNAFTDTQEKEIEELSQLFSQKYSQNNGNNNDVPEPKIKPAIVLPARKPVFAETPNIPSNPFAPTASELSQTAESQTENLPDCFQSQLSAGLQAVIQINITGSETFDGFLYIHSTECTYTKGTAPAPDIIIMADTAVWLDVLKNKTTAQKAFMIGGIKVRGDFVLLTKFDTLFKFAEA